MSKVKTLTVKGKPGKIKINATDLDSYLKDGYELVEDESPAPESVGTQSDGEGEKTAENSSSEASQPLDVDKMTIAQCIAELEAIQPPVEIPSNAKVADLRALVQEARQAE